MARSGTRRVATISCLVALAASVAFVQAPAVATPTAPLLPPEGSIPDLTAPDHGWQVVLDENFDGTTLDESVWTVPQGTGWVASGIRSKDAVQVKDGNLELLVYDSQYGHHAGFIQSGGPGRSANTFAGFDFTYGYVEARMKMPDGPDTSSTFWMMSNNGNDSAPYNDPAASGPEIDIVEHANKPGGNEQFQSGGHWDGYASFREDHKAMHEGFLQNPTATPLQGNYHTYGMLWTPEEYRFYVDGIEVKRVTEGLTSTPEYLILASYVKQASTASFGPKGDPNNDVTLVDYVKVWQRPISDVPDQATAAGTPLAVPFTVQDYHFASTATAEPGSVRVTATSSNTSVVPNTASSLAVSGNGPADPDADFDNRGDFEPGTTGWATTGGAGMSAGPSYNGTQAMRLTEDGSTATTTITGLESNTTYLLGTRYDLGLGYTDTNGNGRVDPGEPFDVNGDRTAAVEWGVKDFDDSLTNDEVRTVYNRNGWTEVNLPAWWTRDRWQHEFVKFTTGPSSTTATVFLDNTRFVETQDDSNVAFDGMYLRPVVSPQRTLAIRPVNGAVGDTTITLTARRPDGSQIGTDQVTVTVGAGSLRDGTFETGTETTPWQLLGGASIVSRAPFKVDRQLQLAVASSDTVFQKVTNLQPNTRYKLEVTGFVEQAGSDGFVGVVQNYGGSQVQATITSTTSSTQSVEFVTSSTATSADVLLLDWDPTDGWSMAEKVRLVKCSPFWGCGLPSSSVPYGNPPDLASVGPQHTVSGVALNIAAHLPSGSTLQSVTSSNQTLVPHQNIVTTSPNATNRGKVFTLTPVQDRSGSTTIEVAYTGAAGSPVSIPVVVSDSGLLQPGFEKDAGWALSGTATTTTSGPRTGARALQVDGSGDARQSVAGLPHGSSFRLTGWVDGTAKVTVRTVPVEIGKEVPEDLAVVNWTGSGWTEHTVDFTTLLCSDCVYTKWRAVEVIVSDADPSDSAAVKVDDLTLAQMPGLRRIDDISLHVKNPEHDWQRRRETTVGRIPANSLWDPAVVSLTTSDISGFGTDVVPQANLTGPELTDGGWPYLWEIYAKAGTKTGRTRVNLTIDDPASDFMTTQSYAVTVNAGNNFNNGDFERSSLGPTNTGWAGALPGTDSHEIKKKQEWAYLGWRATAWTYVGPRDDNQVLRISSGAAKHMITGLDPSTSYTVKLRAIGNGATVAAMAIDDVEATPLGSVAISPPDTSNTWRDYQFTFTTTATGNGSTSVVLFVEDANLTGSPVGPSGRSCAYYAAGESCFDDIGVFKTTDL